MSADALAIGRPAEETPEPARAIARRLLGGLGRLGSQPRLIACLLLVTGLAVRLHDPAPIEMLRLQVGLASTWS